MKTFKKEFNTIFALAHREIMHFFRDKTRMLINFSFPLVFIGVMGAGLESNLGIIAGYSFITFAFTGVIGQILFQTTATGVISLNEERGRSLIQEAFVAPISRQSIIFGKILGESGVSLLQCIGVIIFGSLIGIPMTVNQILLLIPVFFLASFLGGAFGVLVLSVVNTPRTALQIFPLVLLPQIFLGGVFTPIKELPFHVLILSRLTPMTYAVDLVRSIFYRGLPEYHQVVIFSALTDIIVCVAATVIMTIIGVAFFVRAERNK